MSMCKTIIFVLILCFVSLVPNANAMSAGSEWTDGTFTFKSSVMEDGRFALSIQQRNGRNIVIGPFPREHYQTFLKALASVPINEIDEKDEGPLVRFGTNEGKQILTISKVVKDKDYGHQKIRINISKEIKTPEHSVVHYRGTANIGTNRWKNTGIAIAGSVLADVITGRKPNIGETLRDATSTHRGSTTIDTTPSEIVIDSFGFDMDPYFWNQLVEKFVK